MDSDGQIESVKAELSTPILSSGKNTETYKLRDDNVQWVRKLSLEGLENKITEAQIEIVETKSNEKIVIQYPGKESTVGKRRKWRNKWDFRPKILKADNVDLTFAQIWDPLFDDLRSLEGEKRKRIGSALATLFYRMAFMQDYVKQPVSKAVPIRVGGGLFEKALPHLSTPGAFWNYRPPTRMLSMIARELPNWARMSFEAFLHYNSLLAWNEDCKCLAKFEDWNSSDSRGRINTLLTHVRVVGFVIDEVRPSALLGGFTSARGMSPATPPEIRRICHPFIVD